MPGGGECKTARAEFNGPWSFTGGELAQMVERSLSMREVRGSMPRFSNAGPFSFERYKVRRVTHRSCSTRTVMFLCEMAQTPHLRNTANHSESVHIHLEENEDGKS
jgi:hypothetical protein